MGTNFYWHPRPKASIEYGYGFLDYEGHIGKRSAAGLFCWDCREPLMQGGKNMVHTGRGVPLDACPKCGQRKPEDISLGTSGHPAGMELGFAKPRTEAPSGVSGTSSFSWAQDPEEVRGTCWMKLDDCLVENEYGDLFTGRQFLEMLDCNCGIEFTDSIGSKFT